ncbi:cysteine synthase family protein [bacterium]|nr:cysteine synthase family protein [bacterium]
MTFRSGFGPFKVAHKSLVNLPTIDEVIGNTPLVRLRHLDRGLRWPVWVKCEHLNPGGSVKDRLALAILNEAEQQGHIKPGDTLIEATAGNTGMGLALVGLSRGYQVVCVLPEKMSVDKREALKMLGARVVIAPNAPLDSPDNFRNMAARLAEENGWFLTQQFSHPANPRIHYHTTGPEIWRQSQGQLAALVAGSGTGGSLSGAGRYLKQQNPDILVVLADPLGSQLASYVRSGEYSGDGPYLVEGIGSSRAPDNLDVQLIDQVESVSDEESFQVSRDLIRKEGLWVGGSSGTAVAAALRCASRPETGGPVVALVTDSWDRYFSREWLRS